MKLETLVAASQAVSGTRKRKEKIAHLASCLRGLAADEIRAGARYLAGDVRQGKVGIGYSTLSKIRVHPAAESALHVLDVDRTLDAMAEQSGAGSGRRRVEHFERLLAGATAPEQDFLRHLIVGELRQGALEGILLDAIAQAADVPSAEVRRAQMLAGDLSEVAYVALTEGRPGLSRFELRMFVPVLPMLATPGDQLEDAIARLGRAAFEWKLDGARVQIHKQGRDVRAFSRRLNDVSSAIPEVIDSVAALDAEELILDGEVIALDAEGRPLPFQTTMRRFGRKKNVEMLRSDLPVTSFYFDCLRSNGRTLIDASTEDRIDALYAAVPQGARIPRRVLDNREEAAAFLDRALDQGHEGLMVKALDAPYEAGHRGASWLKVKPAHTLDLVVLAAEWGSGRRRGWLSNLHLGAPDPKTGSFVMLGKTFKGMTDELLTWQTEALLARRVREERHVVYVRPELVIEIAFDGLQESPHYPGGLALRFARVKRYRPDKTVEQADTFETVKALHGTRPDRG